MKHSRFKAFLAIFALLGAISFSATAASAQENAAPAVTVSSPAPVPAPAVAEAAKVTARKEDEPENGDKEGNGEAETPAVNPNLTWIQKQVAKISGIPTETSNADALAALTKERDGLKISLANAQSALTSAESKAEAALKELAELNGYLDQMRNAPGDLLAADPAALPPAQRELATTITTVVGAELGKIGQPAKQLPGPGADAPKGTPAPGATFNKDPKTALASAAATQRATWAAAGYVPPGLS